MPIVERVTKGSKVAQGGSLEATWLMELRWFSSGAPDQCSRVGFEYGPLLTMTNPACSWEACHLGWHSTIVWHLMVGSGAQNLLTYNNTLNLFINIKITNCLLFYSKYCSVFPPKNKHLLKGSSQQCDMSMNCTIRIESGESASSGYFLQKITLIPLCKSVKCMTKIGRQLILLASTFVQF